MPDMTPTPSFQSACAIATSIGVLLISLAVGCGSKDSDVADSSESPESKVPESPTVEPVIATEKEAIELETLPDGEGEVDGTFSISQVMTLAHENKLYRELLGDTVDPEVGERLVLLYSSLPGQSSPKGDGEDWTKRANALVDAAKLVVAGDEGGAAAFKRAVNCNTCHSRHRP